MALGDFHDALGDPAKISGEAEVKMCVLLLIFLANTQ
jgi:hypothetical protein